MKKGDKVIYTGASDSQVRWASNDDPRGVLTEGEAYEVSYVEVHTWHTKVELIESPGQYYNSVCFEEVD